MKCLANPHPVTVARYPDATVLGRTIFQSGKYKGQPWSAAPLAYWGFMVTQVLAARTDIPMYYYGWFRVKTDERKDKIPSTHSTQPKRIEIAVKADEQAKVVFSNALLTNDPDVKGLHPEAMPFQAKAISASVRLWERRTEERLPFGLLLASEQGCGKTFMAIQTIDSILLKLGKDMSKARNLVVCPASLISNWRKEIQRWSVAGQGSKVLLFNSKLTKVIKKLAGNEGTSGTTFANAGWFITSYQYCWRSQILMNSAFDFVVYDECQMMKGGDGTKQGTLSVALKATKGKLFLSGTPIISGAQDLQPILMGCMPESVPPIDSFINKFCFVRETMYGLKPYGITNTKELVPLVARCSIRHTKVNVLKELPPLRVIKTYLDVDPKELVEIRAFEQENRKILETYLGTDVSSGSAPAALSSLRRVMGIAKVNPAMELIKSYISEPLVIFYIHTEVGNRLESDLVALGLKVGRIDGKVKPEERGRIVEAFQGGKSDVFIANIVSGGVGLTLTRACTTIFVEFDWNYSTNAQAMARTHRISADPNKNVTCIFTILADAEEGSSLDEKVFEIFMSKGRTASSFFGEGDVREQEKRRVTIELPKEEEIHSDLSRYDILASLTDMEGF